MEGNKDRVYGVSIAQQFHLGNALHVLRGNYGDAICGRSNCMHRRQGPTLESNKHILLDNLDVHHAGRLQSTGEQQL